MMKKKSLYTTVRQEVLKLDTPFCIMNILVYFEEKDITNTNLILNVLSDMYNEGIIEYVDVEHSDDPYAATSAFRVVKS